MNNPNKIYISPSRDHGNDFSIEKGERYSVEYVRADLIAEKIMKYEHLINVNIDRRDQCENFWHKSMYNKKIQYYQGFIFELKKLIER